MPIRVLRPRPVLLGDGRPVLIRPLLPSDRATYLAAFAAMSDETRFLRFAGPKPRLTRAETDYLIDGVDHRDHEALAAIDPATGAGLGVARFVRLGHDRTRADVAVAVTDAWQGLGLGPALVELLASRAREEDVRFFTASTLGENRRALRMLRRFGFRAVGSAAGLVDLEVALP